MGRKKILKSRRLQKKLMNRNFTEFLENIFHFLTFQFFWKISKAEIFHVILLFDFTSFFFAARLFKISLPAVFKQTKQKFSV